jgi:hypothetical protein
MKQAKEMARIRREWLAIYWKMGVKRKTRTFHVDDVVDSQQEGPMCSDLGESKMVAHNLMPH